jgi:DNA-directed RNA polymerase subunit M/transcription elongation factor TFIIS
MMPAADGAGALRVGARREGVANMAEVLKCPGCQAVLRVRDDMVGKQIKCPRCARAVEVPAPGAITEKPGRPADEPAAEGIAKQRRRGTEEPVLVDPMEDEEEEVPVRTRSKYVPCPRCGAEEARRVKFTFWGSYYFTALFKHVRCQECGCAYNGRTGRSNLLPAIVCVTVAAVAFLGVLGVIYWLFHSRGYI